MKVNSNPIVFFLGFFLGAVSGVAAIIYMLMIFGAGSSKTTSAEPSRQSQSLQQPLSTTTPTPRTGAVVKANPEPVIIEESGNSLEVQLETVVEVQGLKITIERVKLLSYTVYVDLQVENLSDKDLNLMSLSSDIVIGDRQLELSRNSANIFENYRPGVRRSGSLRFDVDGYNFIDIPQIQSMKLHVGKVLESRETGEISIDLRLRPFQ